jgi:hypothetical protein
MVHGRQKCIPPPPQMDERSQSELMLRKVRGYAAATQLLPQQLLRQYTVLVAQSQEKTPRRSGSSITAWPTHDRHMYMCSRHEGGDQTGRTIAQSKAEMHTSASTCSDCTQTLHIKQSQQTGQVLSTRPWLVWTPGTAPAHWCTVAEVLSKSDSAVARSRQQILPVLNTGAATGSGVGTTNYAGLARTNMVLFAQQPRLLALP